MPVNISSKPAKQIICVEFDGDLDFPVIQESLERVYAHPDFPNCVNLIVDFQGGNVTADTSQLQNHSARTDNTLFKNEKLRIAIVASEKSSFGMSRVYSSWSKQSERINVFQKMNDAYAWLGID
jgi:hypothetical protein